VGEAQAKLASQAEALEDKLSKLGAGDNAQARLAKLEETLKTLSAAAADPQSGRIPQLAALSGKLDDLEATIASQKEANEAARAGAERLDRELAGVKADASRLTQRVEALRAADDRLTLALRSSQEETAGFKSELAKELQSVVRQAVRCGAGSAESRQKRGGSQCQRRAYRAGARARQPEARRRARRPLCQ
jgi:chromosome segregation ATPase